MTQPAFAPLQMPSISATDHVFNAIYDAVISLKLPPGTKVSESEIARQLGVSRQPVRDAFFRLSNLGFLLIRPQRATQITRISEEAVLNAAFIRTALEVECLRAASERMTRDDIAALRDRLSEQATLLSAKDPTLFHASDDGFHALLCEIAGQGHAWTLIRERKAHMDRVRFLSLSSDRQERVLEEHTKLIDALEARDVPAAEKMLRHHLGAICSVLVQMRQNHSEYFEDPAL